MPPNRWHFVLNMFNSYDLQRVAIVKGLSLQKPLPIEHCQLPIVSK
jgi:hypothetical protein